MIGCHRIWTVLGKRHVSTLHPSQVVAGSLSVVCIVIMQRMGYGPCLQYGLPRRSASVSSSYVILLGIFVGSARAISFKFLFLVIWRNNWVARSLALDSVASCSAPLSLKAWTEISVGDVVRNRRAAYILSGLTLAMKCRKYSSLVCRLPTWGPLF